MAALPGHPAVPVPPRRRGGAGAWTDIPLSGVTTKDGTAVTAWPGLTAAGNTSDGAAKAATLDVSDHVLYWDAGPALGDQVGILDVRAVLKTKEVDPGKDAPTRAVPGVVYDPDAGQAGAEQVGPGAVNLLTGNYTLDAADASAFGVSITRSYNSRKLAAGVEGNLANAFGGQWRLGGVDEHQRRTRRSSREERAPHLSQLRPPSHS